MNLTVSGYDEAYCASSDNMGELLPKLEVDWHAEGDPIYRSYYYPVQVRDHGLGGQRIALRVEEGEEDDVYWLHTDHLGSTSLLSTITGTQVSGSTTRFLPFGDYRTEPESGLTDKGYTGHAHNDPLGLVYMRARYYVASVGRFSQADSIVPDPSNPQSYNRYSYVNNRPLVAIDPTGHYVARPRDGKAPPRPLPDNRYYYSEQYGWFDRYHLNTGRPGNLIDDVRQAIEDGGGLVKVTQKISGGKSEYSAYYTVSGEATDDDVIGIALGIYLDWSLRFEQWEGYFPAGLGKDTSFAIEDLPSQYLGFYAKANDLSYQEVFWMLGGVEGVSWEPPRFSDGSGDWPEVRNYMFTPRVFENGTWNNIPWPDELTLTPIRSGSGLWEYQISNCGGVFCPRKR